MHTFKSVIIVVLASVLYMPLCLLAWAFCGLRDCTEEFLRSPKFMFGV